MDKGMLLVAIGCGRLPGILDITASQASVVFGTMDGTTLNGLSEDNPVYFYETG
jgi:hypothetical protein